MMHQTATITFKQRWLYRLTGLAVGLAISSTVAAGNPNLQIGVYAGGAIDTGQYKNFEQWLGRKVAFVAEFDADTGYTTQDNLVGAANWMIGIWRNALPADHNLLYSVPLSTKQDPSLNNVANGMYDAYFQSVAETLASAFPKAIVRIGWEFNGDWYSWKAQDNPQGYINAFRRVAKIFKAASPQFTIDWCTNNGRTNMDPDKAYPGDDVVDVISMDVYDFNWGSDPDAHARWDKYLTQPFGLQWHADFASRHGKPMGYPEWATGDHDTGDNDYYINQFFNWIKSNNVVYAAYWNSDFGYAGKIDGGAKPKIAAAFKNTFGQFAPGAAGAPFTGSNGSLSPTDTNTSPGSGGGIGGDAGVSTPAPSTTYAIDAGSPVPYTGSDGTQWMADIGYMAGNGDIVNRGNITISKTRDPALFRTERWCLNGYNLPVPNGSYTVKLYFAETSPNVSGIGGRVFDVNTEGKVISNLDVFAEAGGHDNALIKTVSGVNVTDGVLNIGFTRKTECPMIDAIKVAPTRRRTRSAGVF